MRNLTKCIGIFAVGTMMLSTFFVTSCNSEDDFDFGPDSQYSLAERKMTRAGENTTPVVPGIPIISGDTIFYDVDIDGFLVDITVSWSRGFTGNRSPRSSVYTTYNIKDYEIKVHDSIFRLNLLYNTSYWNSTGTSIISRQDYDITHYGNTIKSGTFYKTTTPNLVIDSLLLKGL